MTRLGCTLNMILTWMNLILCYVSFLQRKYGPVRNTSYGQIKGKITSRYSGKIVEEYLGIPYAAPPVGDLRFKRPQNHRPWKGRILETMKLPSACPSLIPRYVQFYRPGFDDFQEDCLYMNIYVPQVQGKGLLPVLLFIHGGSNVGGMGAMVDGDLLAAHGEIIVITFNYRLSILGFYANPDLGVMGNNGLMDQVMAMKWVHENIHNFNGNPHQVTLHGHSAGAANAGVHLISDLTKGFFNNIIIHSGSPISHWFLSDCVRTMRTLKRPNECKEGFSLLKEKSRKAIKDLLSGSAISECLRHYSDCDYAHNQVVIDDQILKESPAKLLSCGQFHKKNVLLMATKDEGSHLKISGIERFYSRKNVSAFLNDNLKLFPERKAILEGDLRSTINDLIHKDIIRYPEYLHLDSALAIFAPMVKLADLIRHKNKEVYMLSFEYHTENVTSPSWIGVQHGWDLFYVFGAPLVGNPNFPFTSRDVEVSMATMSIISDFVKSGRLKFNNKRLKQYNSKHMTYNRLDYINGHTVVTTENNFKKPIVEFANKLLYKYDEFDCK